MPLSVVFVGRPLYLDYFIRLIISPPAIFVVRPLVL
jgi:hypothetical protein